MYCFQIRHRLLGRTLGLKNLTQNLRLLNTMLSFTVMLCNPNEAMQTLLTQKVKSPAGASTMPHNMLNIIHLLWI